MRRPGRIKQWVHGSVATTGYSRGKEPNGGGIRMSDVVALSDSSLLGQLYAMPEVLRPHDGASLLFRDLASILPLSQEARFEGAVAERLGDALFQLGDTSPLGNDMRGENVDLTTLGQSVAGGADRGFQSSI
jgi:hypothetical protein